MASTPVILKPQTTAAAAKPEGPSAEQLRNLPDILEDDAMDVDINPERAFSGTGDGRRAVRINKAAFRVNKWTKKDGSVVTFTTADGRTFEKKPTIMLDITFGYKSGKSYTESYNFADAARFGVSKDGLKLKARASAVKEGRAPAIFDSPGVKFLQSLNEVGVKVDAKSLAPLAGLTVLIREKQVKYGKSPKEYTLLLVDGLSDDKSFSSAPAVASEPAPAQPADDSAEKERIAGLAEALLVQILTTKGTISRDKIPVTVIKVDGWSSKNPDRPAVIALLNTDEFIKNSDAPWSVDEKGVLSLK